MVCPVRTQHNRFVFIMAGILLGDLLGVSGSSFEDFVTETFLNDDGQVRYEGRTINYRSSPRNSGFPIMYVGRAVDQASGITATAGETENLDDPEDASQKAVSKLLGVLRERGLVIDQVQKTAPESFPTEIVPLEPEPKVPEPQPSVIPEQVITRDPELVPNGRSQQPEEDVHDSNSVNDPQLSEGVSERTQEKKGNENNEELDLELELEPNKEPVLDTRYSDDEGEEDPLPDNQNSDEPEKDQGFLVDHAGWWSMRTLMTVFQAIVIVSVSCYVLDRFLLLPGSVSVVFSSVLGLVVGCAFEWTCKILGALFNTLSKGIHKAVNVTLKLSKSFSNLRGLLQPFGAALEVVPDYEGSYAAYVMKKSHPTPDQLTPRYNYQLTSTCKGVAFILNNFDFYKGKRKGSQIDLGNVDHLFRELGYRNVIHENLPGNKIVESFRHFAAMFEASYDSAVVVLMSHGDTGVILGTDLTKVKLRDLEKELEGDRCPGLNGKPKMYFVQACRGDFRIVLPVVADGPSLQVGLPLGDEVDTPLDVVPDNDFAKHTADVADVHIAFATTEGHLSLRSEVIGSFFVQALCEVFFANAHQDNLDTLMNKVAYRVDRMKGKLFDHATEEWINVKQTPECIKRGMRKSVYFLPKYAKEK